MLVHLKIFYGTPLRGGYSQHLFFVHFLPRNLIFDMQVHFGSNQKMQKLLTQMGGHFGKKILEKFW